MAYLRRRSPWIPSELAFDEAPERDVPEAVGLREYNSLVRELRQMVRQSQTSEDLREVLARRVPERRSTETLLTVREVANYLRISARTVYRLIESGQIGAVRVGKQWKIPASDIPGHAPAGATSTEDEEPAPFRAH